MLGQSASLCPNSPQYPQRPLNAFFGPFLLEGVNPNRDSPYGYPTVKRAELQPVTLAHEVDAHKTLTAHKLACSCFVTLLLSSVEQANSQATQRPSQPPPHTTIPLTPLERTNPYPRTRDPTNPPTTSRRNKHYKHPFIPRPRRLCNPPNHQNEQPSQHLLHVIPSIPFTHTSQSGNSNNTTTQTQTPSSNPTTSQSSPNPQPS